MTSKELELQLQAKDSRFSIVDSQNRPGLSNIFFDGRNYDLPVVSTMFIKEEVDRNHRYEFPNGASARFWSKQEILDRIDGFLKSFNDGKLSEIYEG